MSRFLNWSDPQVSKHNGCLALGSCVEKKFLFPDFTIFSLRSRQKKFQVSWTFFCHCHLHLIQKSKLVHFCASASEELFSIVQLWCVLWLILMKLQLLFFPGLFYYHHLDSRRLLQQFSFTVVWSVLPDFTTSSWVLDMLPHLLLYQILHLTMAPFLSLFPKKNCTKWPLSLQ